MNESVLMVSPQRIRELFNRTAYWEMAQDGRLRQDRKRHSHCNPPPDEHPYCTHSQIIRYFDPNGQKVAVVHQYLKPDATLGGSGQPDPKWLLVDGIVYVAEVT